MRHSPEFLASQPLVRKSGDPGANAEQLGMCVGVCDYATVNYLGC